MRLETDLVALLVAFDILLTSHKLEIESWKMK